MRAGLQVSTQEEPASHWLETSDDVLAVFEFGSSPLNSEFSMSVWKIYRDFCHWCVIGEIPKYKER